MDREALEELKKICEEATPGPWYTDELCDSACGTACSPYGCPESHPSGVWEVGPEDVTSNVSTNNEPDAEFIAAARTALPQLIADSERLNALQALFVGADFRWGDPNAPQTIIAITIPNGVEVGADLRVFADACLALQSGGSNAK